MSGIVSAKRMPVNVITGSSTGRCFVGYAINWSLVSWSTVRLWGCFLGTLNSHLPRMVAKVLAIDLVIDWCRLREISCGVFETVIPIAL